MKTILIAALTLALNAAASSAGTPEDAKALSAETDFSVNLNSLQKDAKAMDALAGTEALPEGIKTLAAAPQAAAKAAKKSSLQSAADNAEPLTCTKNPGTALCRRLQKVIRAFNYNCTGAACYGLFSTWVSELRSFSTEYDRAAGWEPKTKSDISDLAHKAATSICSKRLTGDAGVLTRVMLAANPALDQMLELQEGSEREDKKHCQLALN